MLRIPIPTATRAPLQFTNCQTMMAAKPIVGCDTPFKGALMSPFKPSDIHLLDFLDSFCSLASLIRSRGPGTNQGRANVWNKGPQAYLGPGP